MSEINVNDYIREKIQNEEDIYLIPSEFIEGKDWLRILRNKKKNMRQKL